MERAVVLANISPMTLDLAKLRQSYAFSPVVHLALFIGFVPFLLNPTVATCTVGQYAAKGVDNVRTYGATGSNHTITNAAVKANDTSLSVSSLADFAPGQWVMLRSAAPPTSLAAPGAPIITNICQGTGTNCTSGTPRAHGHSTTLRYEVIAFDVNGSWIRSSTATSATGWNVLYPNTAGGQAEKLTGYTTKGAVFYGFYKQEFGHYYLLDIQPSTITTWYDWGNLVPRYSGLTVAWNGLYPDPDPSTSGRGDVLAQISSISGTTMNLTHISPTMTDTPTSITIRHDDTVALQRALSARYPNGGQTMYMPPGTYNVHLHRNGANIISGIGVFINQDNMELYGADSGNTKLVVNSALWTTVPLTRVGEVLQMDGRGKPSSAGTVLSTYNWAAANNCCPTGSQPCSGGVGGNTCTNCSNGDGRSPLVDRCLMTSVPMGGHQLTLSPADATTFTPDDDVLIRTGSGGSGQPDAEYNQVLAVDGTNGTIYLRLPTAKPYAQECYNSDAAGVTSPFCSGRTRAPFAVEQVNAATLHNIKIHDFSIYGLPNYEAFITAQDVNCEIYHMHLESGALDTSGLSSGCHIHDGDSIGYDMGTSVFGADTKNGRATVNGWTFKGVEPIVGQVAEGAYDFVFTGNTIKSPPLTMTFATSSGFSGTGSGSFISGNFRGYNIVITNNLFENCSGGNPCIFEGNPDTWAVGDRQVYSGVISGNTFTGSGGPNTAPSSCIQVWGDNRRVRLFNNNCVRPYQGMQVTRTVPTHDAPHSTRLKKGPN